jgi:hypothetical protein
MSPDSLLVTSGIAKSALSLAYLLVKLGLLILDIGDGEILRKDELSSGGARWLARIMSLLISVVEVLILFS